MGGKITEDIMPNELKKPLDKFANKFGDMFIPKELAKPLMMAAPFLGPIAGPIASMAGSAKQHGGIDYDLLALTVASTMPSAKPPTVTSPATYPQSAIPSTSAAYTAPLQSSAIPGGPFSMQGLQQGLSNVRNMTLGDPASRQLLGEGWSNPFQDPFKNSGNPFNWNPGSAWTDVGQVFQGPMTDAEKAAAKAGAINIGKAGSAQAGVMAQTEIMEDYKKQKERDEAENRGFWQNYFAGMTRNRPYREGRMGSEMDQLYAQYGAADEYDPYYGMQDAYAGTYFDEDRWYGKKGGRIGLQGGGGPHRDIAPRPRRAGLEEMLRKLSRMKDAVNDERRARIREDARVGLALGGNDEVGGLSSLTSQVPKNVPGVPNGMQIDARRPGGTYIDAGTKPKADDVAAMLSEGEFVITKDGMEGFDLQTGGPGDSRSGAKKMYAQMNEWETVAAQAGV